MAYQKKKSIVYQVKERINSMDAMGQSKYAAKMDCLKNGSAPGGHIDYGNKIYSYRTKEAYLDRCCRFAKWARAKHGCQTLDEARSYADEYLTKRVDDGLSAFSVKLDRAALAKLYGQHAQDFRELPVRRRARGGVSLSGTAGSLAHRARGNRGKRYDLLPGTDSYRKHRGPRCPDGGKRGV